MAKYITKIELHNAGESDYRRLTDELEKRSFRQEFHPGKRKTPATGKIVFSREGNISLQQISQDVSKAANTTEKKYSFFVLKSKASALVS